MQKILFFSILTILFGCSVNKNPRVFISTEMGDIVVEIYIDKAPITASNFLAYVDSGKYNNQSFFYRVVRPDNQPNNPIKIEVIQGGFYTDSLIEKLELPPIKHETTEITGIQHKNGTISMARSEPGTASSEFFICIGDQPELDYNGKRNPDGQGFAAFGKVIKGMNIVRKIQLLNDKEQYLEKPIRIKKMEKI